MYKVLIADDEPLILAGLRILVDWNSLGFEICAEARNGRDVITRLETEAFDLILTDIRMPVLNGLELIEQLKITAPATKVIIISGYAEFEYAQQAIQLGVKDFLLKPIRSELLEKALGQIAAELRLEEQKTKLQSHAAEITREQFLYQLANGYFLKEDIQEKAGLAGLDLAAGRSLTVALVLIGDFYEILSRSVSDAKMIRDSITDLIRTLLDRYHIGYLFPQAPDCIGILFYTDDPGRKDGCLKELSAALNKLSLAGSPVPAAIGVGNMVSSFEECTISKKQAQFSIEKQIIRKNEGNLSYFDTGYPDSGAIWKLDWDSEALLSAIEICNNEAASRELGLLFIQITAARMRESSIRILTFSILLSICSLLKKKGCDSDTALISFDDPVPISSCRRSGEFRSYLEHACSLAGEMLIPANNTSKRMIEQVQAYIHQNFEKDLSLKQIAGHFYINSAYLGQLFKTTFGESFNEYLNRIRIREAKKMIIQGTEKMTSIIEKCGYKYPEYFYRQFKKYESISIAEFKLKLGPKES